MNCKKKHDKPGICKLCAAKKDIGISKNQKLCFLKMYLWLISKKSFCTNLKNRLKCSIKFQNSDTAYRIVRGSLQELLEKSTKCHYAYAKSRWSEDLGLDFKLNLVECLQSSSIFKFLLRTSWKNLWLRSKFTMWSNSLRLWSKCFFKAEIW